MPGTWWVHPVPRKVWQDEKQSREHVHHKEEQLHPTWQELFYDLVLVAIVACEAECMRHVTVHSGDIRRYLASFALVFDTWFAEQLFINRFKFNCNLSRIFFFIKLSFLTLMAGFAGELAEFPELFPVFIRCFCLGIVMKCIEYLLVALNNPSVCLWALSQSFAYFIQALGFFIATFHIAHDSSTGMTWYLIITAVMVIQTHFGHRLYSQAFLKIGIGQMMNQDSLESSSFISSSSPSFSSSSSSSSSSSLTQHYHPVPVHIEHLQERFGLFVIIVIGESITATVAEFDVTDWHREARLGAAGLLSAWLLKLLYFSINSEDHYTFHALTAHSSVVIGDAALYNRHHHHHHQQQQQQHTITDGTSIRSLCYIYLHLLLTCSITASGALVEVLLAGHEFSLYQRRIFGACFGLLFISLALIQECHFFRKDINAHENSPNDHDDSDDHTNYNSNSVDVQHSEDNHHHSLQNMEYFSVTQTNQTYSLGGDNKRTRLSPRQRTVLIVILGILTFCLPYILHDMHDSDIIIFVYLSATALVALVHWFGASSLTSQNSQNSQNPQNPQKNQQTRNNQKGCLGLGKRINQKVSISSSVDTRHQHLLLGTSAV